MTAVGLDPVPVQHDLLELLRDALDEDRVVVYAQPVVDLVSGEVRTHELTLRLSAGDGRHISPAGFHPVVERFGLMAELDDLLIRKAVALAGDGHAVAVEVHASSLSDPDLARRTEQAVVDGRVDPTLMTFELAEDSLTSNAQAASAFVHRMHELGATTTIVRFGTGGAGFGYLEQLPLACLKLDAAFIAAVCFVPSDEQFVREFVELARDLRTRSAAEGVPDAATRAFLEDVGVGEGQGPCFGVATPVPPGGLRALAARGPWLHS